MGEYNLYLAGTSAEQFRMWLAVYCKRKKIQNKSYPFSEQWTYTLFYPFDFPDFQSRVEINAIAVRFTYETPDKGFSELMESDKALCIEWLEIGPRLKVTISNDDGRWVIPPVFELLAEISRDWEQTRGDIWKIIQEQAQKYHIELSAPLLPAEQPMQAEMALEKINAAKQELHALDRPLKSNFENEVFVSYAWGGESESMVNELEQAFTKRGIQIKRDKKVIEYKGSIKEFEQRIGQGQCIVLVISDKYLRSEHCMYELVEVDKKQNLRDRIFPIVLADAHIYIANDRLTYINHWDKKTKELNQAIKDVDVMTNLAGFTADLDKYARIRDNFDRLTDLIRDMNALPPETHAASGFSTLIDAVERAMGKNKTI
jgi:hypothetical protein